MPQASRTSERGRPTCWKSSGAPARNNAQRARGHTRTLRTGWGREDPCRKDARRRKLIKVLDEAANKAVGYRGELKNIVIFKYHDDEACGVDGVLRADAKAAAEK